jgi:hypothetical protein
VQRDLSNPARAKLSIINAGLLLAMALSSIRAEELTTTSGQTYHDVQVLSRDSSSMVIQSREGSFKLALSEVKPADRERNSKDLTKAIELPAVTVIGEQKIDFNAVPEQSRAEALLQKEMRRQTEAREQASKKRVEGDNALQIAGPVSFRLGSSDPRNDNATQASYLSAEYQRLAPEIVEKNLRVFSLSVKDMQ